MAGRFDLARANNFDLLRFAAATLVLLDHSDPLTGRRGNPGPFGYETLGRFAVALLMLAWWTERMRAARSSCTSRFPMS